MTLDEQPVAPPKLYGAPAYARPAAPVAAAPRPFDPDLLPLQVHQTDEERGFASRLPAHAYAPADGDPDGERASDDARSGRLRARQLSVRAVAGRLFRSG